MLRAAFRSLVAIASATRESARPFDGRRLRVTGTPFAARSGRHHAGVLTAVARIEGIE